MENKLDFIINAIIKVSKTNRMEGMKDSKVVTIQGSKKGFLKNEEIEILIERSSKDQANAAFVTAIVNGKREAEDIAKEIVYDVLTRTQMLDSKLEMKLDIVLNNKTLRFEGGRVIIE